MRRFKIEKMKISQFPNSITIKSFTKGIKRDTSLFIQLTETITRLLDVVYEEAQKFINTKVASRMEPKERQWMWGRVLLRTTSTCVPCSSSPKNVKNRPSHVVVTYGSLPK